MPTLTNVCLHQVSRKLELTFDDGANFQLNAQYLRVYSPSAEVRGHGPGQETLQRDKQDVAISNIELVGNYALKIHYDDGHNSGLYEFDYLYDLGQNEETHWNDYLQRLQAAGG